MRVLVADNEFRGWLRSVYQRPLPAMPALPEDRERIRLKELYSKGSHPEVDLQRTLGT